MGQAEEKWDRTWGEVGQMRPSGFLEQIAPDSVGAIPDVPQQVQTGSDRVMSVLLSSQQAQIRPQQKKDYTRQSVGSPDSSIVCADSARQDVDQPSTNEKTQIPPDRTAHRPDNATTGRYSSGKDGTAQRCFQQRCVDVC